MSVNVYPGTLDGYKVVSSGTPSLLPPRWLLIAASLLLLAHFAARVLEVFDARTGALCYAGERGAMECEKCKVLVMGEGDGSEVDRAVAAIEMAEAERFEVRV
jgi:hypothetical protein